jgi:hypothetical protein
MILFKFLVQTLAILTNYVKLNYEVYLFTNAGKEIEARLHTATS